MPVFGKSLFATVLDGLEDPDDEADMPADVRVRGLNGGFVADVWYGQDETPPDYASLFDGFPPEAFAAPPETPAWLDRLSETEVAEDLALEECATEQALRDRRRQFARANHPDRIARQFHDQATRRMMIANHLVDRAIARMATA
jgi:hypothetical protein